MSLTGSFELGRGKKGESTSNAMDNNIFLLKYLFMKGKKEICTHPADLEVIFCGFGFATLPLCSIAGFICQSDKWCSW